MQDFSLITVVSRKQQTQFKCKLLLLSYYTVSRSQNQRCVSESQSVCCFEVQRPFCLLQVSRLLSGDGQSGVRVRRGVTPVCGGQRLKVKDEVSRWVTCDGRGSRTRNGLKQRRVENLLIDHHHRGRDVCVVLHLNKIAPLKQPKPTCFNGCVPTTEYITRQHLRALINFCRTLCLQLRTTTTFMLQ